MPLELLVQDIARMKDAGMSVVRVGESTWSLWEAEDGAFEHAWMDRVIDARYQAGIKVITGTPTYSISPSMHRKHPEGNDSRCPIHYQRNPCPPADALDDCCWKLSLCYESCSGCSPIDALSPWSSRYEEAVPCERDSVGVAMQCRES